MSDNSRRFTDQEVAMVLRKASELDESLGSAPATGLSKQDLTEIAAEVGISAEAVDRAVATLDRGRDVGPSLAGAPLTQRAIHAVPAALTREGVARLIQIVDERADATGTVSEALGSYRWTGSDRLRSTLVSITPRSDETSIEVVEKTVPRLRVVFHVVPGIWGLGLVGAVLSALQPSALGATLVTALGVVGGMALGRVAWNLLSRRSGRRVKALAEGLADAAHELSSQEEHDDPTGLDGT